MMVLYCSECHENTVLTDEDVQEIIKKVGSVLPAPSYMLHCKCGRIEWALEVGLKAAGKVVAGKLGALKS